MFKTYEKAGLQFQLFNVATYFKFRTSKCYPKVNSIKTNQILLNSVNLFATDLYLPRPISN